MPTYSQPVARQAGKLKIVELFTTVQGEGLKIGVPSTFVRTGACNLECSGCDTKWDSWSETDIQEVADRVKAFDARHVVFSGGEPTLWQEDLAALAKLLPEFHITIESNGSVPITNKDLLYRVDLWSFSPKVGSLGHDEKFSHDVVIQNIIKTAGKNQIKYVLDHSVPEHVESVFAFQDRLDAGAWIPDNRTYFQPYDRGCEVNVFLRIEPLNERLYSQDLAKLTKLVLERSKARFVVLPQLHKYLLWR